MNFPSCFYNYLDTSLFNVKIVFSFEDNISSIFKQFYDINMINENMGTFIYNKKKRLQKFEQIHTNGLYPNILVFQNNKKNSIHCAIYKNIYTNICPYPIDIVCHYHNDHLWRIKWKNKIYINNIIYDTKLCILYNKNSNVIKYDFRMDRNNEIVITYDDQDDEDDEDDQDRFEIIKRKGIFWRIKFD